MTTREFYITSNHSNTSSALHELFAGHDPDFYRKEIAEKGIEQVAIEETTALTNNEYQWDGGIYTTEEAANAGREETGERYTHLVTHDDMLEALTDLTRL